MGGLVGVGVGVGGAVVTVKSLVIKLGDSNIVMGSSTPYTVRSAEIKLGDSDIVIGSVVASYTVKSLVIRSGAVGCVMG
jgi:hypothetical protein